jgi:cytochrome c-type biogenesis protein CcmH/NrfG
MNQGDQCMERNDVQGALAAYGTAESLFPENLEMQFWHAVALANKGLVAQALPVFQEVFRRDRNWVVLTTRLPAVSMLTLNEQDLQSILSLGRE